MPKEKLYNPSVDILRIISILAVLFIHTSTRTLEASSFNLDKIPWTIFFNQIFRFAVPLFFMISGFVLELNYHLHESYLNYLKKRINRIFIPFVFWSGIYYFFVYTKHTENFFVSLVNGDASYQLYFIPALLIFYLLFPLIHNFYIYFANKLIFIIFALLQLILLYYEYYIQPIPIFYPLRVAFLNYFVFFIGIVASHHIAQINEFVRKWKIIIFTFTSILGGYIFLEGKNLYLQTHNYLYLYSQWRPEVLIYTILLASLLYYIFAKNFISIKIVKKLASLSFFVFFVHVIVLEITWSFFGKSFFQLTEVFPLKQLWFDPLFFLIVTFISFLLAYLAHKIPRLSTISG